MGFFRKLFGGQKDESGDKHGIYLFVQCDNCGSVVRVRVDRRHDLNRTDSGLEWHKTIVDSTCFRRIPTTVKFDDRYSVVEQEIKGGRYISEAEYNELLNPPAEVDDTGEETDEA